MPQPFLLLAFSSLSISKQLNKQQLSLGRIPDTTYRDKGQLHAQIGYRNGDVGWSPVYLTLAFFVIEVSIRSSY